jgi:hypothetical protein
MLKLMWILYSEELEIRSQRLKEFYDECYYRVFCHVGIYSATNPDTLLLYKEVEITMYSIYCAIYRPPCSLGWQIMSHIVGKSTLAHGCRCTHYQKTYFKIFENFENIYLNIHLDILCSFTKFREMKHFLIASVKKTNFDAVTLLFTWPFFVFFTGAIKNIFLPQNFVGEHKLFRYTLIIFCLIFLTF